MVRVVISLTTLPGRYGSLRQTIDSLMANTVKPDAIYLTLPTTCARLQIPYPPLPAELGKLVTVITPTEDYGPICKLIGGLMAESDPSTVIITVDDDVIYPPTLIENLLAHHEQFPTSAISGTGALIGQGLNLFSIVSSIDVFRPWANQTGFAVGPDGRKVDLLFGVAGVLYTRGMFDLTELLSFVVRGTALFSNDDLLISGYLAKGQIDRRVFLDLPVVHCLPNDDQALSSNMWSMFQRMHRALAEADEVGLYPQFEPMDITESVVFRAILLLIVLILLFVAIVAYYRTI